MRIFRIAHPDVRDEDRGFPAGPYTAHNNLMDWDSDEEYERREALSELSAILHRIPEQRAPTPWDDGLSISPGEVCCFISLEQAQEWFCAFNNDLRTAGFMLYIYDIDENAVNVGRKQAVAAIRFAKLVEVVEIPFRDTLELRSEKCYDCWSWTCDCEPEEFDSEGFINAFA